MPTPRAWPDPLAPDAAAVIAWPAWLAVAALVMAVGLVELTIQVVRTEERMERFMRQADAAAERRKE